MIITVHQPEHIPWLGYFNKCSKADILVHLDSVQFEKNNVQNRNRILVNGEAKWLTVPVSLKGHMNNKIKDIKISNDVWKRKYLKTISFSYAQYPYFNEFFPQIEEIITSSSDFIADLNINIIEYFLKVLEIRLETVRSSELNLPEADASSNLLNILKTLNGDEYLSGPSGKGYLNESIFKDNNIKVSYNTFSSPEYEQKGTGLFVRNLSVLDALFNHGAKATREIILRG